MFTDRSDAAAQLVSLLDDADVAADLVVAIPRGGLPVGRAVADHLGTPLDVVVARKIGAPGNPEFALGAVTSDGTRWLNASAIASLGISEGFLDEQIEKQRSVARAKLQSYRGDRPVRAASGQRVVVVDDGVATGATMIACLRQLRNAGADSVVAAVPVGPPGTIERLHLEADEVFCVVSPPHFGAVSQFYERFPQVSDEEARGYLEVVR